MDRATASWIFWNILEGNRNNPEETQDNPGKVRDIFQYFKTEFYEKNEAPAKASSYFIYKEIIIIKIIRNSIGRIGKNREDK